MNPRPSTDRALPRPGTTHRGRVGSTRRPGRLRRTERLAGVRTALRGHAVDRFPLATHGNSATQALRAAFGLELGRVRDRRPVGAGPLNSGRGTGRSGLCVDRLLRWVRRLRMFHVEHVCDGSCVGAWVSLRVRSCVCARSASTSVLLLSPRQFCLCVRVSSVSASFCVRVRSCFRVGVARAAGPSSGSATGARLGICCRAVRWISPPEPLRRRPPVCFRWIVPVTALLGADLSRASSVSCPSLVGADRAVGTIRAVEPPKDRRKPEVR